MRGAYLFAAALVAAGVASCSPEPAVARVVDGHDIDGHFIEPDAYAEFLDGALLEAQGDLKGAEAAYQRALDEDGAAEIWASLGRVRCRTSPRASDQAFQRAKRKGKDIGPVWLADAECALERGEIARARSSAERAAALDPKNAQASLLVVRALVSARDAEGAARWARAARLFYPEAAGLGTPLVELERANGAPSSPTTWRPLSAERRSANAIAALDRALAGDDAVGARAAALDARLDNAALALRAVELGRPAIARELAELTLAAEPGNVDARIAAIAAADLVHDDREVRRWAARLPDAHETPSTAAIRVMIALLYRRVGADAALAFARGFGGAQTAIAAPERARR